jgi:CheY-like chemotaxis protein
MEKKAKILIVDDERVQCLAIQRYLSKTGYEAIYATNREEALRMVQEEKPDIAILDIRMPQMSGFQVLERIRELRKDMPVILSTAADDKRIQELLQRSEIQAVCDKPVDLKALAEAIDNCLSC